MQSVGASSSLRSISIASPPSRAHTSSPTPRTPHLAKRARLNEAPHLEPPGASRDEEVETLRQQLAAMQESLARSQEECAELKRKHENGALEVDEAQRAVAPFLHALKTSKEKDSVGKRIMVRVCVGRLQLSSWNFFNFFADNHQKAVCQRDCKGKARQEKQEKRTIQKWECSRRK